MRADGRKLDSIRPLSVQTDVSAYAEGSVLISCGRTKVLCTATIEESLPRWLMGQGQGWVTAEYGMLPRSTHTRMTREKVLNAGRTSEISRLLGRSLRAAVDLKKLGERQIVIDCDVLQADGGTRTTAVSGGYIALARAVKKLVNTGVLAKSPLRSQIAAISCGLIRGEALVDLDYAEDAGCDTDMNFVMNSEGGLIEVQGTAEKDPFSAEQMQKMMALATVACEEVFKLQRDYI